MINELESNDLLESELRNEIKRKQAKVKTMTGTKGLKTIKIKVRRRHYLL
jgi:hypothetical protein